MNENFRSALEGSAMPLMLQTEDGEMRIISNSCLEATGYSFEEINTRDKMLSKFHPGREKFNKNFILKAFNEGIDQTGAEENVITKNGEVRNWEFHNAILPREIDGKKVMITIGLDVTDRNKYREQQEILMNELKQSELLLSASLNSPKDLVILSFDKDYNYLFFNDNHARTMKMIYGSDIKLGCNILEYLTIKKDRDLIESFYERVLKGEAFTNIERYGENNDMFYEATYSPIYDDENDVIGASVFAQDITERVLEVDRIKESEEKFRLIYSSMSQGLAVHQVITDDDGKPINYQFMDVNDSYLKLFNYKKEDIIGKKSIRCSSRVRNILDRNIRKCSLNR